MQETLYEELCYLGCEKVHLKRGREILESYLTDWANFGIIESYGHGKQRFYQ